MFVWSLKRGLGCDMHYLKSYEECMPIACRTPFGETIKEEQKQNI